MSRGSIAVARSSTFSQVDDQKASWPTRRCVRSSRVILSEFGTRWLAMARPSTAAPPPMRRNSSFMTGPYSIQCPSASMTGWLRRSWRERAVMWPLVVMTAPPGRSALRSVGTPGPPPPRGPGGVKRGRPGAALPPRGGTAPPSRHACGARRPTSARNTGPRGMAQRLPPWKLVPRGGHAMALKELLVIVDNDTGCRSRLDVAFALAAEHGARVVGLHVMPPPLTPLYADVPIPESVEKLQRLELEDAARRAARGFAAAVAGSTVATEWRVAEGHVVREATTHARYADLTVVPQGLDLGAPSAAPGALPA